jgi:tetratricopeptide (TPR) repeat protein
MLISLIIPISIARHFSRRTVRLILGLLVVFGLFIPLPRVYGEFAEGVKKYTAGDYEGAIPYFEDTLKENKENELARAYLLRSLLTMWERYQREKKYEKALGYLHKANKYFPDDPQIKELYTTILKKAVVKETPLPPELKVKLKALAGTLMRVKGEIYVQAKKENIWIRAEVNAPVYPLDRIKTGKDSECEVIFDDGTALRIEANSQVVLESVVADDTHNLKRFDIGVEAGRILSNLEKFVRPESKFDIRTPACIVAVRGTEFATEVAKDKTTEIAVFKGAVVVAGLLAPGGEALGVSVEKDKQTVVKPGEEPVNPFDLSKKFIDYKTGVVLVFEESVSSSRKELDKICLQRAEWIKKKQEKEQLETLKKVENLDLLLNPVAIEKLALSTEQLKPLKELKQVLEKDIKSKRAQLRQAEAELKVLLAAEEVDLPKVKEKLDEIAGIRSGLRFMEVAMFERAKALLTVEQKMKLKELR